MFERFFILYFALDLFQNPSRREGNGHSIDSGCGSRKKRTSCQNARNTRCDPAEIRILGDPGILAMLNHDRECPIRRSTAVGPTPHALIRPPVRRLVPGWVPVPWRQ